MRLPENPILFSRLSAADQAEGMRLMRECVKESFPDIKKQMSDAELLKAMSNLDLRLVANFGQHDAEPVNPKAIWVTGVKSQVFIGHAETWLFLVAVALDNGWEPNDPETVCPMESFPQSIGRNDAASMARILQTRLNSRSDQQAVRMMTALIALLREGEVAIAPGRNPTDDELFLTEPKRPPYLRAVE